jgi:hypothetical protein
MFNLAISTKLVHDQLEEHCVLPGAFHRGQYSLRMMVKRMPQPSSSRFSPDKTPHFIELGGALGPAAADAGTRGCQHEVGVAKRGDFF